MIGRAYSLKIRTRAIRRVRTGWIVSIKWRSGNGYNYGLLPPHYPVPALYRKVGIGPKGVTWMVSKSWKIPVLGIERTYWPHSR